MEDAMLQPVPKAPDQSSESIQPHATPPTILLVEDEAFLREITQTILENAGFSVLPASDACDAIKIYEQSSRPIDLLMTDMVLPGQTGEQLGQDLRRRSPRVKVLVTSGYGDAQYGTEDPATQTYFLAKPYSGHHLIEKIEKILDVRTLRHATDRAS
jgi:DNA-binding NtrC family response regulator